MSLSRGVPQTGQHLGRVLWHVALNSPTGRAFNGQNFLGSGQDVAARHATEARPASVPADGLSR